MATKKTFSKHPTKIPDVRAKNLTQTSGTNSKWLWLGLILLLTFIAFYPSLNCQFTSWDDPQYVTLCELIKNLSFDKIQKIFSPENSVALNYHPLTVLSFAIDYHFSKLNPFHYHLVNVLIHILNTLLVFIFIYRLSGKKLFPAIFVSTFFGIHPMHVESVTWVSERKDVLYAFFFIASLICYLKYTETKKTKLILFTFILFVLSVMSKAMAVVLPAVLLLLDFYKNRKITFKVIAEKIPFLLVSLIFGIIAVNIQLKEAIATYETFPLFQRICFGIYGFANYIFKLILPINLSSFYPYPLEKTNVAFPLTFYSSVFVGLLIFISIGILILRKSTNWRPLIFGIGFYFITLIFVLQFISVGQVIMADRYTYIAYIGLLFPIGMILNEYITKKPQLKSPAYFVTGIITLLFSYITHERTKVWQNTETLFTNVIDQYPYPPWIIEIAYVGRGKYYATEKNDIDKALTDFNTLLAMKTKNATVYNNLGNIYSVKAEEFEKTGDTINAIENFKKSLDFFSTSISLDSNENSTYVNRGTAYIYMKYYSLAAADFNRALQTDSLNIELMEKRAFANYKSDAWKAAIIDYDKLVQLIPEKTYLYQYRAFARINLQMYNDAIDDLKIAIQREPQNRTAYYYLTLCYYYTGDKQSSIANLQKAMQLGYPASPELIAMIHGK